MFKRIQERAENPFVMQNRETFRIVEIWSRILNVDSSFQQFDKKKLSYTLQLYRK